MNSNIWAGKDLSNALAKGGKWATGLPPAPPLRVADIADGSWHSPTLAQSRAPHSAPDSWCRVGVDAETHSSCHLSHHLTEQETGLGKGMAHSRPRNWWMAEYSFPLTWVRTPSTRIAQAPSKSDFWWFCTNINTWKHSVWYILSTGSILTIIIIRRENLKYTNPKMYRLNQIRSHCKRICYFSKMVTGLWSELANQLQPQAQGPATRPPHSLVPSHCSSWICYGRHRAEGSLQSRLMMWSSRPSRSLCVVPAVPH